ncbi:MAG: cupin domain-containing protein [Micrococcales bacterium]|nr:cupin domain-containing protein [Micrococcales bacterium]
MPTDETDQGPRPFTLDIEAATLGTTNFRTTIWTGAHLQATLMSIDPGEEIGLEVHPDSDQFLRVEGGRARVQMGPEPHDLSHDQEVTDGGAVFVPAGTWHNVTALGDDPVRLYAIYAPRDHVPGTIHRTKGDAETDPNEH